MNTLPADIKKEGYPGHIHELDAIRGLAAFGVLLCHLPRGFWFGETGVDLFFVLSGFLISSIILRGIDQPGFLIKFYIRRSLRIFPVYYLAILAAFLLNLCRRHPGATDGLPFYLLYLQNIHLYWGGDMPPVNISLVHTWTLAIEEQFYLVWPAALLFLKKRSSIFNLAIFFFLLPVLLRFLGLSRDVLLGHTDGLALGTVLALYFSKKDGVPEKDASGFIGLFAGCFVIYGAMWAVLSAHGLYTGKDFVKSNLPISILSVAYFGLVGFIVTKAKHRCLSFLRSPWLIRLGAVSYGLYLYHWIIYEFLDTIFFFRLKMGQPYWLDLLKITLSVGTAFASWYFIEKPILRLKDRFNY